MGSFVDVKISLLVATSNLFLSFLPKKMHISTSVVVSANEVQGQYYSSSLCDITEGWFPELYVLARTSARLNKN